MNTGQVCVWTTILIILASPWFIATLTTWIYYGVFPAPATESGSGQSSTTMTSPTDSSAEGGTSFIAAIIQTCSGFVYVIYILLGILWVGCHGRASLCSYCCIALGIPIFAAIPAAVGLVLLVDALGRSTSIGHDVGVAAAVCCLLSTIFCIMVTLVALVCGSRGKGRNHRFPFPLAHIPFLKEFEEYDDTDKGDADKYTSDYPAPLNTSRDRRSSTASNGAYRPGHRKNSAVSLKSETPSGKISNGSWSNNNGRKYSMSNPSSNGDRSENRRKNSSVSIASHSRPERKVSTASAASATKGRSRKQSVVSDNGSVFSKPANKSSERSSRSRSRDRSL